MAWLHTPVDTQNKDVEKKSRYEEIKLAIDTNSVGKEKDCIFTQEFVDDYLKMPDIDSEYSYIIEWINEIGFYESNGMGAMPISFLSIQAWANLMQENPTPFDVKLLREMSSAFIAMQETAKKHETPDPIKELSHD